MRKLALLTSAVLIPALLVGLSAAPTVAMGGTHDPGAAHGVIVSSNPANFTPHVRDGSIRAFARIGNTMYAGGTFTQVKQPGGTILSRTNLFAFDATTGAIEPFSPTIDGQVNALATDGTSLFVGGVFKNVNGTARNRLAKLDPVTGEIVAGFAGKISSGASVMSMQVSEGVLYLGGAFSAVNGQARQRLAALDPTSGALDPSLNLPFTGKHNSGQTRVQKLSISPDGGSLVAIGNFTQADGMDRHQIAMVDLTTSPKSVASWATDRFKPACSSRFDTYLRDVDFAPDGSYFVVVTTGAWFGGPANGVLCDTTTRWESAKRGAGQQPTWADYTGGDTTWSVAATGTAIYVGGHMRWENNPYVADAAGPGAVPRKGIAALDPVNGLPFSWNPSRDRGEGVFAFYVAPEGLWVGSDTDHVGGEYHAKVAFMPASGGTTVPPDTQVPLPNDLYTVPLSTPGQLDHRSFTGTQFGTQSSLATPGIDWTRARGAFVTNSKIYTGWSDGAFYARSFNGSSMGAAQQINLNGLSNSYFPLASVTGMFFINGRLFYTVAGDQKLYYRYFTPESDVVGASTFVASGVGDGLNWSDVQGMTLASGRIYFARTNGNLYGIDFVNGAPVGASLNLISGPSAHDGRTWGARGMFVLTS